MDKIPSKKEANIAIQRIHQLRSLKEIVIRQKRDDVAMLLKSCTDTMQSFNIAMIRVERILRENNLMIAYEMLIDYCELLLERILLIESQRYCPSDMIGILSGLIYATKRCKEVPELGRLHKFFKKKYGTDFIHSAENLLPDSCVSAELIAKLSISTPTIELKLKVLKEIANEYNIKWGSTENEFTNSLSAIQAAAEYVEKDVSAAAQAAALIANNSPSLANETKTQENDEHHSKDAEGEDNASFNMRVSCQEEVSVLNKINEHDCKEDKGADNASFDMRLTITNSRESDMVSDDPESSHGDTAPPNKSPLLDKQIHCEDETTIVEGADNASFDMRLTITNSRESDTVSHDPESSHGDTAPPNKSPLLDKQIHCEDETTIVEGADNASFNMRLTITNSRESDTVSDDSESSHGDTTPNKSPLLDKQVHCEDETTIVDPKMAAYKRFAERLKKYHPNYYRDREV